jgi:hypothetical protein
MPQGEKPRSEPEIIPPDSIGQGTTSRTRVYIDGQGIECFYIATFGLLGVVLAALMTDLLLVLIGTLVVGAFLLWIPLVIFFIGIAIVSGHLRTYFRRTPRDYQFG